MEEIACWREKDLYFLEIVSSLVGLEAADESWLVALSFGQSLLLQTCFPLPIIVDNVFKISDLFLFQTFVQNQFCIALLDSNNFIFMDSNMTNVTLL